MSKQSVLDALDAVDLADQFLLAIQLISPSQVNGEVLESLATVVLKQNEIIRSFLDEGRS